MAHHELQRAVKDACKTVEAASAALKAKRYITAQLLATDAAFVLWAPAGLPQARHSSKLASDER